MSGPILIVMGTRPEAIKLAPVITALRAQYPERRTIVCSTGQHREMLRQVTDLFGIEPDVELDVMQPNQTLSGLASKLFAALDVVVSEVRPEWLVVQGDTTTAFVGATVGYYHRVRVGHVEAGLRTGDKFRPFPEEVNRRFVTVVADAHFAPTQHAREALLRERVAAQTIHVTGNTVVDAVMEVSRRPYDWAAGPLRPISPERPIVLITAHRRESFGEGFRQICEAIRHLALEHGERGVQFVYPVHLNPNVRGPVLEMLGGLKNVFLLAPIDYQSLVQLMMRATLVLTDSGGIQEEAPAFGVPVCVMRDTTERPEGVEAGVARLVGTRSESIIGAADSIIGNPPPRDLASRPANPYGDGRAAERIAGVLCSSPAASAATEVIATTEKDG